MFVSWFWDLFMRSPKLVCVFRSLLVFRNQHCENRRQQHENERLDKSDKHFQKIKGNRQNWRQPWDHGGHRLQNTLARINVSEQPETERDWPEQNRNHFKPS